MEEHLARLADLVVPKLADFCTIALPDPSVERDRGAIFAERLLMRPSGRRDPAWIWYGLAAAALLAVPVLELTGVLGRLGP